MRLDYKDQQDNAQRCCENDSEHTNSSRAYFSRPDIMRGVRAAAVLTGCTVFAWRATHSSGAKRLMLGEASNESDSGKGAETQLLLTSPI